MVFHVRIAIMLLAIAPVVSTSMAQEKTRIFLGASSKTLGYSPLWVATKKGFFEQQGLDVQLVLLRGVPMTLQALAGGSLHFGSGGPEPYIEASERGGLDYPRDYKLLVIAGGSSANLTALQSGQIAATTVAVPLNYAAEESGLNVI